MKAIRTTYHGPTDTSGARIWATDEDHNSCRMFYRHELSPEANHRAAAIKLAGRLGWGGAADLITGALGRSYVHVFRFSIDEPSQVLERVRGVLSGEEWSPSTLEDVAEVLNQAGYPVEDVAR